MEFTLSAKAFDVKQTRTLASEITQRGAGLFDALDAEHELKVGRAGALQEVQRFAREGAAPSNLS